MEKIAHLHIEDRYFTCSTYIDGKIDSLVSLPEKDWWDIPNLFKGLQEHNYQLRSNPPTTKIK